MMILSQYHIFELDTINIYSVVCNKTLSTETPSLRTLKIMPRKRNWTFMNPASGETSVWNETPGRKWQELLQNAAGWEKVPAKHAGKILNELNMLAYALCQHCPCALKGLSHNIEILSKTFTSSVLVLSLWALMYLKMFSCCFVLEKQEYPC